MKPNLQHAIERVERPGGSHEGVGRKKINCTCSVMFVGGTSLYEITTTFWLKVAFIAFNSCFSIFFSSFKRLRFICDTAVSGACAFTHVKFQVSVFHFHIAVVLFCHWHLLRR